ncbi:PQQ-dependent sugar dehydrogenase [soil metagenome]
MLAAAVLAGLAFSSDGSAEARSKLRLQKVGQFDSPIYVNGPTGAGSTLFVVERKGKIEVMHGGKRKGTFLNIRKQVRCCDGERGLYSVAFANYRHSKRFYVYYTRDDGDLVIAEYKIKHRGRKPRARAGSGRVVLRIEHSQQSNHNGGQLQFGPDGYLYAGTGDGGGGGDPFENGQDKGELLAKMLRIDPRKKGRKPYRTPRSNPYVGRKGRNEIYSIGLRNPFRFSFDGNKLAIGDVGQDRFEEVDYVSRKRANGGNFGWDDYEGNSIFEGPAIKHTIKPIKTYSHGGGRCSITGGYVSHDKTVGRLRGRYVYADLCTGQIRSLRPKTSGARNDKGTGLPSHPGIDSFGVDAHKHLYIADGGTGGVYRIVQR